MKGAPMRSALNSGKEEIFNGDETRLYDIPAFPAGSYSFVCTVHPNMVGDVVVQ